MQDLKRILLNTSLFQMLSDRQLASIISGTRTVHVACDAPVIRVGEQATGMFLIVFGQVKIGFDLQHNKEKALAILDRNKCFGLGEMLLGQKHLAFVKATKESMLLHIDRDTVLDVAHQNFQFSHELMVCVGRQFYTLVRDIESYSRQSARQRLAGYLLRQRARRTDACIELEASKGLIASRLSLAPHTLSRLFHDFSSEGLIAMSGRQIRILDDVKMHSLLA